MRAGHKSIGVRGVSSPAKTRTFRHCGKVMQAARTVRRLGVLPELNIFRCVACDEVVTIIESATSLVQVPAELGFI
jgi:hypothetical protein